MPNPIKQMFSGVANSNDSAYMITFGTKLTISKIFGGADNSNNATAIEVFYAPNYGDSRDLSGINLIHRIFVNGSSYFENLNLPTQFTGDGVCAILLRVRVVGAPVIDIFGGWEGYES